MSAACPAKTTPWSNAVLLLTQRLRSWANNKTTLGQRFVSTIGTGACDMQKNMLEFYPSLLT